jgi:hypothetical protein
MTRCSEDNFRATEHDNTWNSGNTGDNATWDSSKLKYNGRLNFYEKNHH